MGRNVICSSVFDYYSLNIVELYCLKLLLSGFEIYQAPWQHSLILLIKLDDKLNIMTLNMLVSRLFGTLQENISPIWDTFSRAYLFRNTYVYYTYAYHYLVCAI